VRQISFALTTAQFLDGTKTVTRRLGWGYLCPGTLLQGVEKSQGLGKGGKVRRLGVIRVVSVRLEPLQHLTGSYGSAEAAREGFPGLTGEEFARMFCENMRCGMDAVVTRIEFEHVEQPCPQQPLTEAEELALQVANQHRLCTQTNYLRALWPGDFTRPGRDSEAVRQVALRRCRAFLASVQRVADLSRKEPSNG